MNKIKSIKEKEDYFASTIKEGGAYFNIKYPRGTNEFIWVTLYKGFNEDGSDWYLEAPTQLRKYDFEESYLERWYDEHEEQWFDSLYSHMYIEGSYAYEVDSPQTSPFLPETFEIEFVTDSCKEACKYMLDNNIK